MTTDPKVIDVEKMSLDQWLELVFDPPSDVIFTDYEFPTEQHKAEYLASIDSRTDEEVKRLLLNFLIPSSTLGIDEIRLGYLADLNKSSPEEFQRLMRFQYHKRLLLFHLTKGGSAPPWEGITWILDLLPHFPKSALEGLAAYTFAHIQLFPDGRLQGMWEAEEIIRAKYIGFPKNQETTIQTLMTVSSREFEHLIERLYSAMGYETQLTPPQKDGGRDVIACRRDVGKLEQLRVECKLYNHPVGVALIRSLLGVVSNEKVNKGVLVTTNRFTSGAKDFAGQNPRLELIEGKELVPLMNEHLGPTWSLQINQLILESQRENSNEK